MNQINKLCFATKVSPGGDQALKIHYSCKLKGVEFEKFVEVSLISLLKENFEASVICFSDKQARCILSKQKIKC